MAVLGSGAWGTALAAHCRRGGSVVRQWVREPQVAEEIRRGENRTFLPGVPLPPGIEATTDLAAVVEDAGILLAVVPCQFARDVYRSLSGALPADLPLVAAAKGIEEGSLMLPVEVIRDELGETRPVAVLSGPSFASDVARGKPTALVAAAEDAALADYLQDRLASAELRIYTNSDPVGVQLGGALKNVVALAAGILDGLGTGPNGRAALITRGLAEMTRLGSRLGGSPATFAGLAGLGDLVLTCTGEQSRNLAVGRRLGRGESLDHILDGATAVAEGIRTARPAHRLAQREAVRMPIVEEVNRVLYEGGNPRDGVQRLMGRPLTSEDETHEIPHR
ncbi:MAG: NAD(P)-dependent glycerol-3-phosphate dehydrogenase [Acidobacteria bacterium]|nr:MAG: NAD(P)-dependent glycerol-3-phosphate dehydrogenase [Acidobacteriota bacterium]